MAKINLGRVVGPPGPPGQLVDEKDFVKKTELQPYATMNWVNNAIKVLTQTINQKLNDKLNRSEMNTKELAHNNKGVGFYYDKTGKIVTCAISGISNENLQDGWHTVNGLPAEFRPKKMLTTRLSMINGNKLLLDQNGCVTFNPNGEVRLRVISARKGQEWGGEATWTTK